MAQSDESKSLKQLTETIRKDKKDHIKSLKKLGKTQTEIDTAMKQMAVSQKMHLQAERDAAYKQREEALVKELREKKNMSEANAKREVTARLDLEKEKDKKRLKRDKSLVGRMVNAVTPKSSVEKEKQIEAKRQQKGFFKSLKSMFSKKDKEAGSGIFGFMKKIFSKIKGVFALVVGKFLLIGALVVGLIASMNIDQLKEVWGKLKEAFKAIWEFLEPIISTIWEWVSDTAIPALVDGIVNIFKGIGELFKNLKERFSGFTEMSWVDRMWAIFGAFEDIGSFLFDMIGNFAVTVEKMFGGDGTWITGIWKDIKGFFSSIGEFLTKLFTNPVETIDGLIMSTFAWIKDIGKWLHETLFTPFVEWFQTLFDFSTIRTTIESMINMFTIIPDTIKKYLLDPAVKWLGDVFGFDSSKFTKFSVGELFTKAMDDVVAFFNNLFNIDLYAIFSDILGKAGAIGKKIWNYFSGDKKKPAAVTTPSAPVDTTPPPAMTEKFSSWYGSAEGKAALNEEFGPGGAMKPKHIAEEFFNTGKWKKPKETIRERNRRKRKEKRARLDAGLARQRQGKSGELAQIQADEGFREGVYEDTVGIKTIGYGFNLERQGSQEALDAAGIKKSLADLKGGKANLTEEEASRLMQGEMGHFKGVAERYVGTATWKKLSPNRQGILTNMAYNMGEDGLGQFENLRKAIQKGDWKEAQTQMASSKWAGQVKGRADRLVARMGGTEKSNDLNSVQMANNTAKDSKGRPIVVSPTTIGGNTTVHKEETTMLAGTAVDPNHPQSRQGTAMT